MSFTNINKVVFPVGRVTPDGVSLLGTAFLIGKQGRFVTATHVVNNDDTNLVIVLTTDSSNSEYNLSRCLSPTY